MASAFFKTGQAEEMLQVAYDAREVAARNWDASEFNRIDGHIRWILDAMRCEVRLGLRDDPMITLTVASA